MHKKEKNSNKQMNIKDYQKDYFIDRINKIDVSKITPIEAINILYELTEEAKRLKEKA